MLEGTHKPPRLILRHEIEGISPLPHTHTHSTIRFLSFQLLDDGTGRDPLEVHNFGKAGKYLFRPCQNEDGTPDEVSFGGVSWDPSAFKDFI